MVNRQGRIYEWNMIVKTKHQLTEMQIPKPQTSSANTAARRLEN